MRVDCGWATRLNVWRGSIVVETPNYANTMRIWVQNRCRLREAVASFCRSERRQDMLINALRGQMSDDDIYNYKCKIATINDTLKLTHLIYIHVGTRLNIGI